MTKKTKTELATAVSEYYRRMETLRAALQSKRDELFLAEQELIQAEDQWRNANAELASSEE